MAIKYSVIIPHYNSEDSLEKLLESIPSKNHIEVIVVDERNSSELFRGVIKANNLDNLSSI